MKKSGARKSNLKAEKKSGDYYNFKFLSQIKNLYFRPKKFLESVENEKEYFPVIKRFILFYIFYIAVVLIYGIIIEETTLLGITKVFIFSLINAIATVFLIPSLVHLGVLIFKRESKLFDTFKPMVYSLILAVVYLFI